MQFEQEKQKNTEETIQQNTKDHITDLTAGSIYYIPYTYPSYMEQSVSCRYTKQREGHFVLALNKKKTTKKTKRKNFKLKQENRR